MIKFIAITRETSGIELDLFSGAGEQTQSLGLARQAVCH